MSYCSDAARCLWSVYSPILIVFGLLGNSLSLLVTSRGALRGMASSRYLLAIAVADNGALIFGLFPRWLQYRFGVNVTAFNDFLCKTCSFLSYASQDASIWLVCAFTFDRLIVVVFPLRRAVIRAKRRIHLSIGTVVFLAVLKNAPIFWSRSVVTRIQTGTGNETESLYAKFCSNPSPSSAYFENYVRPWIVFVTAHCVPFLFLIACNVGIVREIVKVRYGSWRHYLQVSRRNLSGISGLSRSRVARMTGLCLAVSLTFLVLEFPSTVLLIGRPYWRGTPAVTSPEGRYQVLKNTATPEAVYKFLKNTDSSEGGDIVLETNSTSDRSHRLLESKFVPNGKFLQETKAPIEGRYRFLETTVAVDGKHTHPETNTTPEGRDSLLETTATSEDGFRLFEAIASLLSYTNSAVNFYLYCLAGAHFRKEFVSMITRDKSRKHLSTKFNRNRAVNHRASQPQVPRRRLTDVGLIDTRLVHRTYADESMKDVQSQISRSRSSTM